MIRLCGVISHDLLFTSSKRVTIPSQNLSLLYSTEHVVGSVPTQTQQKSSMATTEGHKESSGMLVTFCFLTQVLVTPGKFFQISLSCRYAICIFFVCSLYLNKVCFNFKAYFRGNDHVHHKLKDKSIFDQIFD